MFILAAPSFLLPMALALQVRGVTRYSPYFVLRNSKNLMLNTGHKLAAFHFVLKILPAIIFYGVEYEMYTSEVGQSFRNESCISYRTIMSAWYREKEGNVKPTQNLSFYLYCCTLWKPYGVFITGSMSDSLVLKERDTSRRFQP